MRWHDHTFQCRCRGRAAAKGTAAARQAEQQLAPAGDGSLLALPWKKSRSGFCSCHITSITPVPLSLACSSSGAAQRCCNCFIRRSTSSARQYPQPCYHHTTLTPSPPVVHPPIEPLTTHLSRQRGGDLRRGVPPRVGAPRRIGAPQRAAGEAVHVHCEAKDVLWGSSSRVHQCRVQRRWGSCIPAAHSRLHGPSRGAPLLPVHASQSLPRHPSLPRSLPHLVVDGAIEAGGPLQVCQPRG